MLRVEISVNGSVIAVETAVRIKGGTKPESRNIYELSDGCTIEHTYGNGALKLAHWMIDHLEMAKVEKP